MKSLAMHFTPKMMKARTEHPVSAISPNTPKDIGAGRHTVLGRGAAIVQRLGRRKKVIVVGSRWPGIPGTGAGTGRMGSHIVRFSVSQER